MFSKACEYAIRASIFIATKSLDGERASINDIIDSVKGPTGGFIIDKEKLDQIKLHQIVFAIDGDRVYSGCGLGMKACSEKHPCPVHNQFKIVRNGLCEMLETTDIKQLWFGLKNGLTFLKI